MNVKERHIILHVEYLKIALDNILFDKKLFYTINMGRSSYSSEGKNEPLSWAKKKKKKNYIYIYI